MRVLYFSKWCPLSLLILFQVSVLHSQKELLLKESFYQVLENESDPSSLIGGQRTLYAYDANDQVIHEHVRKVENGKWYLWSETDYEYNAQGKLIKEQYRQYPRDVLENASPRFIFTSKYEYEREYLSRATYTTEEGEFSSFEVKEYIFDAEGRNIFFSVHRYSNNNPDRLYRSTTYEYNADDCTTYRKDSLYFFFDNEAHITKNVERTTYFKGCQPLNTTYFEWNNAFGIYELSEETLYEYRVDSIDQISSVQVFLINHRKDSEMELLRMTTFSYDQYGYRSFEELVDYSDTIIQRTRTEKLHNEKGQELLFTYQSWDNLSEEWMTYWTREREYLEDLIIYERNTNLIYTDTSVFEASTTSIREYDLTGKLLKSTVSTISLTYDDRPFSQTYEETNEYGCDGRLIRQSTIYTHSDFYQHWPEITDYKYYNTPYCEKKNIETATLNIFPNPSSHFVHVSSNKVWDRAIIMILDSKGKIIEQLYFHKSNYASVNTTAYPPGAYIVHVVEKNEIVSGKFIKQ